MNWLSYGAGVNSTALAVLLHQGQVPEIGADWTPIFADTGDEKAETYRFLGIIREWFKQIGHPLVTVSAGESVYEMWFRKGVTGSRRFRSCTDIIKRKPIERYIKEHDGGRQIHGIDAGESHRARNPDVLYPLVELNLDRDDCLRIICSAGLPNPGKSGCWHCPFNKVSEILALSSEQFGAIRALELNAEHRQGRTGHASQWSNRPVSYWESRAKNQAPQQSFELEMESPCGCYDG